MNQVIQLEPALRDSGWKSKEIVRSKAAISVYAPEKSILVSSTRKITAKDMQNLIMQKLIIHEPFGHALRSANAERNGNEVGQFGTATYSTFEESFEIALEQCFIGKHDPSRGLDYYIAAGLTVSDKMPAQEISRILESMHQLKKATSPLTEKAVSAAQRMTGMQLKRTFSGMTDVDAGIAHLKDINYLHGLNGTWKLLNYLVKTDTLDNGMEWLLSAKFNPYDADDRQLMSEFSPMPDSLISFFDAEQKDINDYAK